MRIAIGFVAACAVVSASVGTVVSPVLGGRDGSFGQSRSPVAEIAAEPPSAPPEADVVELDDGEELLTEEEAMDTDAAAYAEMFEVSASEAESRLEEFDRLHDVMGIWEDRYPDTYAGTIVTNTPTFTITVRFKDAVPADAAQVAADADVEATFDGSATSSQKELEQAADDTTTAVAAQYDTTATVGFSLAEGVIEVTVESPPESGGKGSEAAVDWRRSVVETVQRAAGGVPTSVEFVDHPVVTLQGGRSHGGARTMHNQGIACTTGFPVYRDGAYGEMTAGHCPDSMNYRAPSGNFWDMNFRANREGQWGDFQWNTTPRHDVSDAFYTGFKFLRKVKTIKTRWAQGDFLCKYGRTSGYGCSDIRMVHVSGIRPDGVALRRMVLMQDFNTERYDSGAPWFLNNRAVGIHFGWIDSDGRRRSSFSKFENLDDAFPGMYYVR